MKTVYCDHGHPVSQGDVRKLPLGGGSNVIVCRKHYQQEMAFRRATNKELTPDAQFPLPEWDDLEIYEED